jgi:hypothetical protein
MRGLGLRKGAEKPRRFMCGWPPRRRAQDRGWQRVVEHAGEHDVVYKVLPLIVLRTERLMVGPGGPGVPWGTRWLMMLCSCREELHARYLLKGRQL